MRTAVFLDRDGVINKKASEGNYITKWKDFELLPGVVEAIRLLNKAAMVVFIVSNQRGVARGVMSERDLKVIHMRLKEKLAKADGHVKEIYYCCHDWTERCSCRKPAPGMLLRASAENDIELATSWIIGDSVSDIEAGKRAGCQTILVTNGRSHNRDGSIKPDLVAPTLIDAVKEIVGSDAAIRGVSKLGDLPKFRSGGSTSFSSL